jgi:uncharacterized delta-60 repeat protein
MSPHGRRGVVAALLIALATAVVALAAPGDLDRTYDGDGSQVFEFSQQADVALDVQVRPDGKLVVVGYGGSPLTSFVALENQNGSFVEAFADAGFAYPFPGTNIATRAAVQPDGKIVVVGGLGVGPGSDAAVVARLNPDDGSPDHTFDGDGVKVIDLRPGNEIASSVALQADGKILVGGTLGDPDPNVIDSVGTVVRLTPQGAFDPDFGVPPRVLDFPGVLEDVSRLAVQPDGRILAAASNSTSVFGAIRVHVARLTAAGDPDQTFGPGGRRTLEELARPLAGLELLPDGRMLVATDQQVARVLSNGLVDPAFGDAGVVPAGEVRVSDTALQSNGKLLLIGDDGNGVNMRVVRLQPGGTPDTTFGSGGRANIDLGSLESARAGAVQADGRILAAGRQDDAIAIVRLEGDPPDAGGGPGGARGRIAGGGGVVPRCGGKAATIVGTARRDVLRGTPKADVIVVLGGGDVVRAGGGRDVVCGGGGADRLSGGAGADRLLGGPGNDRLRGQAGPDRLLGEAGRDLLAGGAGADRLLGAAGRDRCIGGLGRDVAACERTAS